MNRTLLVVLTAIIVPFTLSSGEPSAFGAGNLNNPKPYGLTSSEEVILENKQNLHNVVVKSNNQENKVDSIRDRIDGLQNIIEGLAIKSQENKINFQKLSQKNSEEFDRTNEYVKRLTEISQKNSQSIEEVKSLVAELSLQVDSINTTYVTKKEFNTIVEDVNKFKDLVAKELKSTPTPAESKFNGMDNPDIYNKAKFYYDKKYYTDAIEHYSYLIDQNYKPATAHYMIGEMKYYRKNYSDAIAYFKKSASLYSDASYMPTLMLHTAVSMENTGDKNNAKTFYNAIVAKYPNTKYAISAKKYLSSMN
ncbi:MAG: hypothetical protein AUK54_01650 [Helicobacteraceae bacterium CG2_30_36_10]|nr:MAG: hypothetical protein AUK54_01650 [Helicobacteraceae bacterium CG2_30_36_10]